MALGAAAGTALWGGAPEALAAGVSIGKPIVNSTVVAAGQPVTFAVSGRFTPPKDHEGEDPWIGFRWDFGDDTNIHTRHNEGGTQNDAVQKVYLSPGEYTVKVTAYHGFTLFGFKFSASRSLKVRVLCEGTNLGPAKAPPSNAGAFNGEWQTTGGRWFSGRISLSQRGEFVHGQIDFTAYFEDESRPQLARTAFIETEVRHGRLALGSKVFEGSFFKTKLVVPEGKINMTFVIPAEADSPNAYRQGLVYFDAPFLEPRLTGEEFNLYVWDNGSAARQVELSARLSPPGPVVPGKLAKFVIQLEDIGPACIPADRVEMDVLLVGCATNAESLKATRLAAKSVGPTDLTFKVGALGSGAGRKTSQAKLTMTVLIDNDPSSVRCIVRFRDTGGAVTVQPAYLPGYDERTYFPVTLPAELFACVEVKRPKQ